MSLLLATVAGGNVTVTPPSASLVLTGYAPAVLTPRLVTPGVRALVLTGFAPSVATPRKVTPANAALILAGFAATVQTPRKVTPAVRALTLTGFVPTASTPRLVRPANGALVLTGFAPSVIVTSPSVTVTPDAAALTLSTFAPIVTGDVVTVVETPKAPTGELGHVVSDTGRRLRFPLPTDYQPVTVSPDHAQLRLTGYPPSVIVAEAPVDTSEVYMALFAAGVLSDEEFALLAA